MKGAVWANYLTNDLGLIQYLGNRGKVKLCFKFSQETGLKPSLPLIKIKYTVALVFSNLRDDLSLSKPVLCQLSPSSGFIVEIKLLLLRVTN